MPNAIEKSSIAGSAFIATHNARGPFADGDDSASGDGFATSSMSSSSPSVPLFLLGAIVVVAVGDDDWWRW